jgi:UDP-N-acetyl-2-amino-2-deoxyglucuronate dehydrogenase
MSSSAINQARTIGDDNLYLSKRNKLAAGLVLLMILVATLILYRTLWGRGFSDPDDFLEINHYITTQVSSPLQLFLTSHYGNFYRPIASILTAVSTYWSGGNAGFFLARNLAFYLLSIVFLFYIVLSLTSNQYAAALAACLFAFHPANVNSVSIVAFTNTFGLLLILWAVYILSNLKVVQHRSDWFKLALVVLLLGVTTFAYEMYFWVLPTYVAYLLWRFIFQGKNKTYLVIIGMAVLVLLSYLIIRQSVVQEGTIFLRSAADRYGLKSAGQILRNLAMFAVGASNVLDFLFFINPIDETVPTTLSAFLSPGLLVSLVLGLMVTVTTIIASLVRFVLAPKFETALPLVFVILSLLYVSVVSVVALASDTYLNGAVAFLSIAQSLVLYDLANAISLNGQVGKLIRWSAWFVLVAIILTRALGVDYRNNILADKAARVSYLQSELRRVASGFGSGQIVFVSPCAPPLGYSVYGGRGMVLVIGEETPFVQLTLNQTRISAVRSDPSSLKMGTLKNNDMNMILIVDNQGKMYHVNELSDPTLNQNILNFAIIGCGRIAPRHAQALAELPEANLVAACDIIESRAHHFAQKYGCVPYTDYRSILDRSDIDIVSVCVPSGLHVQIAQAVAQAGKHVLVEKPIALNLADADALIRTCESAGVTLGVVLQNRFNPPMRDLRHLVDSGKLGRIVLGNATVRWYRPQEYYEDGWHGTWAMDGGALMNQSIHHIDALQWLMGDVASVFAYTDTLVHRMEAEDVGVAVVRFKSGALGIIEGSTVTYPENLEGSVSLFGERGSVKVGGTALNRKVFWKVAEEIEHERETLAHEAVDPPSANR